MIELRKVTKEYSKGNAALNGISVKIERGEFVFIVGDSGSGKSTLIKLIMKELNPTEGTIIVNGQNLNRMKHRNIAKYRRGLGVVFQDFRLLKDRNIYENIAFALRVTETPTRIIKKKYIWLWPPFPILPICRQYTGRLHRFCPVRPPLFYTSDVTRKES